MMQAQRRPSDEVLTRKQTMEMLHVKPAFFSKLVNGKVPGLPPLRYIRVGRRLLFLKSSIDEWLLEAEKITCSVVRSNVSKTVAA
jgi:hypothetical protein